MSKKLVIIGGLAAGMKTAAKARRENKDLEINVYQDEDTISYSRCGMPYYISDVIEDKGKLILRTPEEFQQKNNINVHINHRAIKINTDKKEVIVKDLIKNEKKTINYDYLVIATGSKPRKPDIEGIDCNNVYYLRDLADAEKIKTQLKSVKKAAIIGGGYIGFEMAETLKSNNIETTIISESRQVLSSYDEEIAHHVAKYTQSKGVKIIVGDKILKIESDSSGYVNKIITTNNEIEADLVIIAKGTVPNAELAKEAGIEIGKCGGIKVNERMETSVKDIYSGGDCCEINHLISNTSIINNTGSLANVEGRVIADNISGLDAAFRGTLGTQIVKIFDLTLARTGLTEKKAKELNINYESVLIAGPDRPSYMMGSEKIIIKMLARKEDRKILGIQIYGLGDVSKRIDVGAVALTAKMTTDQVLQADLTYAPPYTGPIDAIAHAASVLDNKLKGEAETISPVLFNEKLKKKDNSYVLIDVRSPDMYDEGHIENSINIPMPLLTKKLNDLDKNKETIVNCVIGKNSYNAYKTLKNSGFTNVKFLEGGVTTWIEDLVKASN